MLTSITFRGESRKRVLVTGATGTIGKELTQFLKAQPNQDVFTLSSANRERIDLSDRTQVTQLLQAQPVDMIYHLAVLSPLKSNRGIDYFNTNVQGTENLLQSVLQLKRQGKKAPQVFLASTALVYTPEKIYPESFEATATSEPIQETALENTLEMAAQRVPKQAIAQGHVSENLLRQFNLGRDEIYYNDSKLLAEMAAKTYAKAGVSVKVGRLVNCYGQESNQLMNLLLREANEGKQPTLYGKDSKARDYLFIDSQHPQHDDVLRLIQAVAEKGKNGEAYNISSGGRFVRSPQAILKQALKAPENAENAHGHPSRSNPNAILSNQKLLQLGVAAPKTSPETGMAYLKSETFPPRETRLFSRWKEAFSQLWQALKNLIGKLFCRQTKTNPNV